MFHTAIGDIVKFQVKFTLKEGLVNRQFSFLLTATRQDQEYFDAQTESEKKVKEVLAENITDWADQRLILLQNNEPAPYSPESFEFLAMKYPSVIGLFWTAYLRDCGCKEKN